MTDDKAKIAYLRKLRAETASVLGYDTKKLSAGESTRLDLVFGLRLALDELREQIFRGKSVDGAKLLSLSEALEKYLPPRVAHTAETHGAAYARAKVLELILNHKAAAQIDEADAGDDGADAEIAALQARILSLEDECKHLRGSKPRQLAGPNSKPMRPVAKAKATTTKTAAKPAAKATAKSTSKATSKK